MSNKVMSIKYTLYDANTKEELDSNITEEPLEFITGQGQIISGLENQLINMVSGDSSDILVSAKDAYGEYEDAGIQTLPKEQFAGIDLIEDMTLYGTGEQGESVEVTVISLSNNDVTIDYNHKMAGKDLMFNVTIVDIREATAEELETGVIGGLASSGGCCGSHSDENSSGSCCSNH